MSAVDREQVLKSIEQLRLADAHCAAHENDHKLKQQGPQQRSHAVHSM